MRTALAGIASLCIATTAFAQGSLGVQGFGYPPGQISTRAEGMGGGPAELDAGSALNPAAVAGTGPSQLYFQYDPEFRTVAANGTTSKTTTARFPIVNFILPVTSRLNLSVGSSTLVDRSSETQVSLVRVIDTSNVTVDQRVKVLGAIDDVRLALGYAMNPSVRVGLAAHVLTGTNQITLTERFPNTTTFTNLIQASRISYTGTSFSGGLALQPSKVISFGFSAKRGGTLRAEAGDTLKATGRAPDHYGASVEYTGWGDVSLAAHVGRDQWSSMGPLASSSVTAYDAWDVGAGAEGTGPRFLGRRSLLRLGVRHRTLPFSTTGSPVTELAIGGGLGIELSPSRAGIDIGLIRAGRSSSSAVSEHAYILSFGLRVVP